MPFVLKIKNKKSTDLPPPARVLLPGAQVRSHCLPLEWLFECLQIEREVVNMWSVAHWANVNLPSWLFIPFPITCLLFPHTHKLAQTQRGLSDAT